jgi:hypothetical protein
MMLNMFCTRILLKTQDHEGEGESYMERSSCIEINAGSNLPTLLNNSWLACVRATSSGRKPRGKL